MSAVKNISIVLAIAIAALLPTFWPNPYYIHLMVVIGIYSILLLGLDIVVGYVGEVSLGHAALFGIGSYTAGVLHFQLAVPFLLAVPASIAVTGLFGAILALPALRVNGPYLAMVTLAVRPVDPVGRSVSALSRLSFRLGSAGGRGGCHAHFWGEGRRSVARIGGRPFVKRAGGGVSRPRLRRGMLVSRGSGRSTGSRGGIAVASVTGT